MEAELLVRLYEREFGHAPSEVVGLAASGSARRYYRLAGPRTVVGVIGTSTDENERFIAMSEAFGAEGLPVPRVIAVSDDRMGYLQDDLGDESLFAAIAAGRMSGDFTGDERRMLAETIATLPRFQFSRAASTDFGGKCRLKQFDRRAVMWDLNYFKYCFLKGVGIDFSEDDLEDDFDRLAGMLMSCPADHFMYRDFQSRNVMMVDGKPWFIDFQGGRRGPCHYDVASFLWQAKAALTPSVRDELAGVYVDSLRGYADVDRQEFGSMLRHFVLFRTLQVLGAYGYRGYFERKPHFVESVPFAIANLKQITDELGDDYPYISRLATELSGLDRLKPRQTLTVDVMSFSYKRGLPVDDSGNGGGFVFDCRAIHNPGRYEKYKRLTGRDTEVVRFLEEDGEILTFLDHVYALVDASVERYIRRGFSHLSVGFGCTGGQHRSVYSAEATARHLRERYGINVVLTHRERDHWQR
ncbi:MAG: phosphotransferase [Pseudoflavonifractor sp.]|nr:phosphotransferase [Pseudoflavonifractor sp.]